MTDFTPELTHECITETWAVGRTALKPPCAKHDGVSDIHNRSDSLSDVLIATAAYADTFILIEAPQPWNKPALSSPSVPSALRQVLETWMDFNPRLRVHLIADTQTPHRSSRRILIFQQPMGLAQGYDGWEIQVDDSTQIAETLARFFRGDQVGQYPISPTQRHLLICTHARHNQCCGMYGYPFYVDALETLKQLNLSHVHIWQISHIGGHRFAPTLIDFPHGRYYGKLDHPTLLTLLKQDGAIAPLLSRYRGYSLFSKPLQILEHDLWQRYQWSWLKGQMLGKIVNTNDSQNQKSSVEILYQAPNQLITRHTADIVGKHIHNYRIQFQVPHSSSKLIHNRPYRKLSL
jgi:hypothetical protein